MPSSCFLTVTIVLLCLVVPIGAEEDVVWYFGATAVPQNSSTDPSVCGRTLDVPCSELSVIFGFQFACAQPNNFTTGSNSTTIVLLQGAHSLYPLCFDGWANLSIIASDSVSVDGRPGFAAGVLSFQNCQYIQVEGIHFTNVPIGRSAIYFERTDNLIVRNCTFTLSAKVSTAIQIIDPAGSAAISECTFAGNASEVENARVRGVDVRWGSISSDTETRNDTFCSLYESMNASLSIERCSFFDLIEEEFDPNFVDTNIFKYSNSRRLGTAVRLRMGINVCGVGVLIRDNSFDSILAIGGSTFLVSFDTMSRRNSVSFAGNNFTNNKASYGGGVGIYHWRLTGENSVTFRDSLFENNTATVEGGALFCVFLSEYTTNHLAINSSQFVGNAARYGSAHFIANSPYFVSPPDDLTEILRPPILEIFINNCLFARNFKHTPSSVGTIVFQSVLCSLAGNNSFHGNLASCLVSVDAVLRISGHLSCVGNSAPTGSCMYLLLGSRVDLRQVESAHFTDNTATTGSIIDTDSTTSSESLLQYIHTESSTLGSTTSCFIVFSGSLNPSNATTRFIFRNNTATLSGALFSITSLHFCDFGYFVPRNVTPLVSIFPDNNVVDFEESRLQSGLATDPTFAVFYGASTQCYKTVGNVTYLLPNCSHQLVQDRFLRHAGLQCALRELIASRFRFRPGYGLHPTLGQLLAPWAGIDWQWDDPIAGSILGCPEANVSKLVLSPAPGEQFDLTILVLDQMLNLAGNTAIMKVTAEDPGVLLLANGRQYGSTDLLYFTPNRAVTEVALGGLPGTKGIISISVKSRVLFKTLVVHIPFELASCPLGLLPPIFTPEQVRQYIAEAYITRRVMTNSNPLLCRCISEIYTDVAANSIRCIRGYTARLSQLLWMGQLMPEETKAVRGQLQTECPSGKVSDPSDIVQDSVTNWIQWNSAHRSQQQRQGVSYPLLTFDTILNPVDVARYEGGIVPGGGGPVRCYSTRNVSRVVGAGEGGQTWVQPCPAGYCRTTASTWAASDPTYPCVDNRQGVLCGQCKEGFAVSPLNLICRDCEGSNPVPVIALYLLCGLVVVVGAILLNFGALPALDILLFFLQAALVLLSTHPGYQAFSALAFFSNLNFSFDLCFTPTFNALDRSLMGYFSPSYILILVGILISLTRIKVVAKYLGSHSCLQALWLLLLLSYVNLLLSAFSILHCVGVGDGAFFRYVLVDDASIQCYQSGHLAAGIASMLLLVFVILPFPVYLTVLLYFPKWKPFTDVYARVYKDNRQWWVFVVLLKRITVVAVGVFVKNLLLRQYALIVCFLLITLAYGTFVPYPSQVDNGLEIFGSILLVIMSLLSVSTLMKQNGIELESGLGASWFLVALMTLLCGIQIAIYFWKKIRDFIEKKTSKKVPRLNLMDKAKSKAMTVVHRSGKFDVSDKTTTLSDKDDVHINDYTVYREPLLDVDKDSDDGDEQKSAESQPTTSPSCSSSSLRRYAKRDAPKDSTLSREHSSLSTSVWTTSGEF